MKREQHIFRASLIGTMSPPADAGHPAQGEVLADINGASAWIVTDASARS